MNNFDVISNVKLDFCELVLCSRSTLGVCSRVITSRQGYKVVQDYRRIRRLSTEQILCVLAQYRYKQITIRPVSCTYLRMYQWDGILPYQTKLQHQNSELEVFILY